MLSTIRNPDDYAKTLAESNLIEAHMISSDEACPIRQKFGCPITITVMFRPASPTSINAHLIGLAIRAKLNIILP